MMHLLADKAAGPSRVFDVGLEQDRERFRIARGLGTDIVVETGRVDVGKSIIRRFGLDECREAFEAAHRGESVRIVFEM